MNVRAELQTVINTVTGWPGIESAAHRFGGVEFKLGQVEVGHVHHNGMVDIPFTRKLREQLVAGGEALPHHLLDESGWITFWLRQPEDTAQAVRLFRLSYLHKSRRLADAEPLEPALIALGFSAEINDLLLKRSAQA